MPTPSRNLRTAAAVGLIFWSGLLAIKEGLKERAGPDGKNPLPDAQATQSSGTSRSTSRSTYSSGGGSFGGGGASGRWPSLVLPALKQNRQGKFLGHNFPGTPEP